MTETATPSAETSAPEEAKTPRQPRLTVTVNGETHALLKYPFPVKAAKFPVTVNGQEAVAACTAGRGKAYTYILFNNTSFYIPGTLPPESVLEVTFPENYKFDDKQQARVSSYKPKKKAKSEAEGPGDKEKDDEDEGDEDKEEAKSDVPKSFEKVAPEVAQGQSAKRRVKGHASSASGPTDA